MIVLHFHGGTFSRYDRTISYDNFNIPYRMGKCHIVYNFGYAEKK